MTDDGLMSKGWLALLLAAPVCCGGLTLLAAGGFGALAGVFASKGLFLVAGAALVAGLVGLVVFVARRRKKDKENCCDV